ncbi:hypothetical protein ACFLR4_04925 [Bacteroidota bacterium]
MNKYFLTLKLILVEWGILAVYSTISGERLIMKVKINLDTDDYLILILLLFGSLIAVLGIYMVFVEVIDYLHGAISNIFQN